MLYLTFYVDDLRYGLSSEEVVEVLPVVHLKPIPKAPGFVRGLLNFHETAIPVIDLSQLFTGSAVEKKRSTRIVLANYKKERDAFLIIGLMVERATETILLEEERLEDPVVSMPSAPYLGKTSLASGEVLQCVTVSNLLPEEVQTLLYPSRKKLAGINE